MYLKEELSFNNKYLKFTLLLLLKIAKSKIIKTDW